MATKRYLSKADIAELIGVHPRSLKEDSYNLPEPAVVVGRSPGWTEASILAWDKKRRKNVSPQGHRYTADEIAEWVRMRSEGMTLAEISAETGVNPATISRRT